LLPNHGDDSFDVTKSFVTRQPQRECRLLDYHRMARPLALAALILGVIPRATALPPAPAGTITVLTLNTKLGGESPWSPTQQIAAIAAAQPDIVMLQEPLYLQLDQYTSGIADAMRIRSWSGRYARHCRRGVAPTCRTYGAESVMLLTRLPIVDSDARLIWAGDDTWEARGMVRVAVRLPNGRVVQAFACHLPAGPTAGSARERWVRDFKRWGLTLPQPQIVGGDFNDSPTSRALGEMKTSFIDAWSITGGAKVGTESSDDLTYANRYDYVFTSGAVEIASATVLPVKVSDHRPVVATLRFTER
jgi:endonuclease/exonuclease/phosphatase family metal-dependent hydrolase